MSTLVSYSKAVGVDEMEREKNITKEIIVEREFIGKITAEKFVENIIKKHYENNENTKENM